MRSGAALHAGAAALYLAASLWAMRAVLPAPAETLAYRTGTPRDQVSLAQSDQRWSAWAIARNAHWFLTRSGGLFDPGVCHPVRRALTFGEHALGVGLLGLLPYAATREPILTANVVNVLVLWLPALAMYALVWHFTRDPVAALVAGAIAGFHPRQLGDPGHPFIHSNHWTVLALLCAHRLCTRASWGSAAALALCLALQLLESFYVVLIMAVLGGVYGTTLLVAHRRRLPALLPKLLAIGAVVAAVAAVVMEPYLQTRAVWGLLQGREHILHRAGDFAPGRIAYPGTVPVALAAVGVWDRMRRRRPEDPRLPLLAGGLLCGWLSVWSVPIPGTDLAIPSPLAALAEVVPGLGAVRGLGILHIGLHLVLALLAGYGVVALLGAASRPARVALAVALLAGVWGERFWDPACEWAFGRPVSLTSYDARPSDEEVALYADTPDGAVLDLPFTADVKGTLHDMAYYLVLAAHHHRRTAACFHSFRPDTVVDVAGLASVLDPVAADGLYALGFRTIVAHEELMGPWAGLHYARLDRLAREGRIELVRTVADHRLYRWRRGSPTHAGFDVLAEPTAPQPVVVVHPPEDAVELVVRNAGRELYRHPDPVEPVTVVVAWYDGAGTRILARSVQALLPLVLGPGAEGTRKVVVPVPEVAGALELRVALAADPDRVIARRHVVVAVP